MVSVLHVPMDSEYELSSHACVSGTLGVCCPTSVLYTHSQCVHVYLHASMYAFELPACLATCSVTHLFWVYSLYVYAWTMIWAPNTSVIPVSVLYVVCASSGHACPMCIYCYKTTVCQLCEWMREKKHRIGNKECVCTNHPADQPINGHLKPFVLLSTAHRTYPSSNPPFSPPFQPHYLTCPGPPTALFAWIL